MQEGKRRINAVAGRRAQCVRVKGEQRRSVRSGEMGGIGVRIRARHRVMLEREKGGRYGTEKVLLFGRKEFRDEI